jgi:hypothetical protein
MKVVSLLHDVNNGYFGKAVGRVWTIEYQKRGLPHLHLLLFLQDRDFFLREEGLDEVIHTRLPDPNGDPVLLDIVWSVMIHTPCLGYNDNAPCLIRNEDTGALRCSKRFPKLFCDKTTVEETGYSLYKCPNNLSVAFYKKIAG